MLQGGEGGGLGRREQNENKRVHSHACGFRSAPYVGQVVCLSAENWKNNGAGKRCVYIIHVHLCVYIYIYI